MRYVWYLGFCVLWYLNERALCVDPNLVNILSKAGNLELQESVTVYPRRTNNDGSEYPVKHHFHKRSVRENWDNKVDYKVDIGGKSVKLNLERKEDLVAPNFMVQHFKGNLTWLHNEGIHTGLGCYYEGSVPETVWSHATLSLCDGMTGMFSMEGEHFFIEPLKSGDNSSEQLNQSEQIIPHQLYKLKQLHKHIHNGNDSSCGVNTENFKHRRRKKRDIHSDIPNLQFSDSTSLINSFNKLISSSTSTLIHHRTKRSVSHKNYVEVMVAADHLMARYHGEDLQHYILNLMAIVNSIYKNHTIKHFIHIVIVKIVIFHTPMEGPQITDNAGESLKRFCRWQMANNEPENSKFHYDTAVMMTRVNICRAPGSCDTLGLAEIGTMCDPKRSCSIVQDNGITAAFTITHELGHVFNLPHDDDTKCRQPSYNRGPKDKTHIMAPIIDNKTDPWSWSECSSQILTKFLDGGHGWCLRNKPPGKKYRRQIVRYQKKKAGSIYNVHKQCELSFGNGFYHCPFYNFCQLLYCTNSTNHCQTQQMPMADGTSCDVGKWCINGECVKAKLERKVKGGWSKWQPYEKCSRTCGGGIKKAYRECTNPVPSGGGRYCIGKRVKYSHCNTEPCPKGSKDFRIQQCAEYRSRAGQYTIPQGSKWIPKYDGILSNDYCKLYCKADSSPSYFYMLNSKVIDGTKCHPDSDNICVNGQCKLGGCDNRLGSKMKRDRCGVCGGDNASCKTVSGEYHKAKHGYSNVTVIPAGATNIKVLQLGYAHLSDDENYLALVDSKNNYILNGNYQVSPYPLEIDVKGGTLFYTGSEIMNEAINSTGRLEKDLQLQILTVGQLNPPKITYSYIISLESELDTKFVWTESKEWTECSSICNGMRFHKVKCVREHDNTPVSEQRCENQAKPLPGAERCNEGCIVSWRVNREECSNKCGQGIAKQVITCTQTTRYQSKIINITHCEQSNNIGPRPAERATCYGKCRDTMWEYSDWTECTSTCGGGAQKRSAVCVDMYGKRVDERLCNSKELVQEQTCNTQECPQWKMQGWTGCSVTCGVGYKHGKLGCFIGDKEVIETQCNLRERPNNKRDCYMSGCPSWETESWGECSTTCDMGIAIRAVMCKATSGHILDDFRCDATKRPAEIDQCNNGPCPATTVMTTTEDPARRITYTWTKGHWTHCSASCGEGIKQRYVTCMNSLNEVADKFDCDQLAKPPETETCIQRACGFWRMGDWSDCSVSCGDGTQTRAIVCSLSDRKSVEEIHCDLDVKPDSERQCTMDECRPEDFDIGIIMTNTVVGISHWRIGPWSACSTSCGVGWQRRQVLCHDEKGASDNCDTSQKPDGRQTCNAGACPQWVKGEWSQCSGSCGERGMQKRTVKCQSANGETLPDSSCEIFNKPSETGICNNGPCSNVNNWQVGSWSPCSVTCGTGSSQRDVICVSEAGTSQPSSACKDAKPRNTKRCSQHPCPSWAHTRWGKCSTTCGAGVQTRRVVCRLGHGDIVPDTMCLGGKRPRTERRCSKAECAEYMWNEGPWSQCSKECGFGFKTRDVTCIDVKENVVNSSLCSLNEKPKPRRRCSEFPCPFMWNTSPWSECSVSCGEGVQTRHAVCQAITKEGWILPGAVPYGCQLFDKPTESQICNFGPCQARYRWITGPWGECSARCGNGFERRQVQCVDSSGKLKKKKLCSKPHRPDGRRPCYNGPCYANSCKQLKEQTSIRQDGSYKLFVHGRLLEIYCKNMKKPLPQEFISLPAGETENFSEIYPHRLKRQKTCPNNGTRQEPCKECRIRTYRNAGKTSYSKIKIDILTLKVQVRDLTFATSVNSKNIPFGSAGDCYSSNECPQGRFNINLSGTGLIVTKNTTWLSQGTNASQKITRLQEGEIVEGLCGGSCGWCTPKSTIQLQVLT